MVVGVAADERVVLAAAEQEVIAAPTEQEVVAGLAEELVGAGAPGQGVVVSAAEQVGSRERPIGLVEAEHVVAGEPEDSDLRSVGDRRRAAGDGDAAVVDEDPAGGIAADLDVVRGAVTDHAEYSRVERGGCGRARRPARDGDRAGANRGAGK